MSTSKVKVKLSDRSYDILIGSGLIVDSGRLIKASLPNASRLVVITNDEINKLYGRNLKTSLKEAGFDFAIVTVPAGERYKSLTSANKLYGKLLNFGADRETVIVALGGGVIGDLAGFVAATYMRGIPLVQIPTTLLAQVDSSVGGKTAVNHRLAKNIIGAFYQPQLVIIDPETLRTLSARELRTGLGEVVKYAFISGDPLFEKVKSVLPLTDNISDLVPIIIDCCRFKADVVGEDEHDLGRRAILNYGHTIGHALEAVAGYRQYNHGEAISVGMMGAALVARAKGWLSEDEVQDFKALAGAAGLPLTMKNIDPDKVLEHLKHDKKRTKGSDNFVLLKGRGKPVVSSVDPRVIKETLRCLT